VPAPCAPRPTVAAPRIRVVPITPPRHKGDVVTKRGPDPSPPSANRPPLTRYVSDFPEVFSPSHPTDLMDIAVNFHDDRIIYLTLPRNASGFPCTLMMFGCGNSQKETAPGG